MKIAIPVALLTLSMAIWAQAQSGPPALCKPCLFYGGDLNPNDINAMVFPNEDTVSVVALTYGSINVPKNRVILVEGLLIQTVIEHGDKLDPQTGSWQIRTNILNGNGGTLVGAGSGLYVAMQPTGRQFNGYPEYTIALKAGPIQLSGGSSEGGRTTGLTSCRTVLVVATQSAKPSITLHRTPRRKPTASMDLRRTLVK